MNIKWISLSVILFLYFSCTAQLPDSLAKMFRYDRSQVPAYVADSTYIIKNVKVERITYISTDSFVVSAFLTQPMKRESLSPLIVYGHYGEGDKTEFIDEAISMSENGFICILPDGPWLCPDSKLTSFERQGLLLYKQYFFNIEKAIDLAEQQFKINTEKIFCVGHSFGCNTAVILASIDERIDYFVFMAGVYQFTDNIENSKFPDFVEWRKSDPAQFQSWVKDMKSLNVSLYMPYKKVPCLIQVANQDEYISNAENDAFISNMPEPKEALRYDAIHKLNSIAEKDRKTWMLKNSMR